MNQEKKLKEWF